MNFNIKLIFTFKKINSKTYRLNSLILMLIVFLGLVVRFINIDGVYPVTDGFTHLVSAKNMVSLGIEYTYPRFKF